MIDLTPEQEAELRALCKAPTELLLAEWDFKPRRFEGVGVERVQDGQRRRMGVQITEVVPFDLVRRMVGTMASEIERADFGKTPGEKVAFR